MIRFYNIKNKELTLGSVKVNKEEDYVIREK